MAARNEDEHFEFLATIIAVQHRVGGNLSGLLITLATSIADRLQLRSAMRSLTAQARFSGWVLSALLAVGLAMVRAISYVKI